MTTETVPASSYDEVVYPSDPLPDSHPDRLATVARIFGMRPQPIDRCRVLELGCGTGGNLIPMAERHSQSSFTGIDYSQRQIRFGLEAVKILALENIELAQRGIQDLGEELGKFDYIICHGVYSWVSPELQDKILSLCKSLLAPQGVAYLSYNVYPAWHLRSVIREVASSSTSADKPLTLRVAELRRALTFLTGALDEENTSYGRFLKDDVEFVLSEPDDYLVHEYFETEHRPLYFHEFAGRVAAHRLQYLGDAVIPLMFASSLGPTAKRNLAPYAGDLISFEQHIDALWNRSFRNSLLCHDDVPLVRAFDLSCLSGLYFAGELRPENPAPDLASAASERFLAARGVTLSTPSPTAKAAFYQLGARWPLGQSLRELIGEAQARLQSLGRPDELTPEEHKAIGEHLLQCVIAGIVELRSAPDSFVAAVSSKPRAGRLALVQARSTSRVTNRRHQVIVLDEVSQNTLAQLDGRHDRTSLLGILREALAGGRLSILRGGLPVRPGEGTDAILDSVLDQALTTLARNALLVA